MKFGQKLEQQSVPEWSIHNVDYNSLKHEIKAHTTRDQARARAIAIPGQPDPALDRFEAGFYAELCRQHDRVVLFVESKASEVCSRLEYLTRGVERLAARGRRAPMNLRQQRRLLRHQHEVLQCGDDVQALARFTAAQAEAFRKILKKYKKWTGSPRLGDRFKEHILADPKSFTRRDFTHLRALYDETRSLICRSIPQASEPTSPESAAEPERAPPPAQAQAQARDPAFFQPLPPPQILYWNEYDHGSDGGDATDETYALYIVPDEAGFLPGFMASPLEKARSWLYGGGRKAGGGGGGGGGDPHCAEGAPLLLPGHEGAAPGYATFPASRSGTDDEDDLTSNEDACRFPPAPERDAHAYGRHRRHEHYYYDHGGDDHYDYATLVRRESRASLARYRSGVMFWGTVSAFCLSLVLMGVAGLLLVTGRRGRRAQVNAGATVGGIASMFCACAGLGMHIARKGDDGLDGYGGGGGGAVRWWVDAVVWVVGLGIFALDGMLLVLVMEW